MSGELRKVFSMSGFRGVRKPEMWLTRVRLANRRWQRKAVRTVTREWRQDDQTASSQGPNCGLARRCREARKDQMDHAGGRVQVMPRWDQLGILAAAVVCLSCSRLEW